MQKKNDSNPIEEKINAPDISPDMESMGTEGTEPSAEYPEMTQEEIVGLIEDSRALALVYASEHEQYMRLAAEYDNFRKRSQKERESAYADAKLDTAAKFLPVFDDLERALAQPTSDEPYARGVELIAQEFSEIIDKLGMKPVGEVGESFDPLYHSAVMHIEDESLPKNVITEVFQKGYISGDKVVRFALVKVAN